MSTELESYDLWRSTLAIQGDSLDGPRGILRQSFLSFRERIESIVSAIGSELPGLTVHDITHIDALWRVSHQICGDNYPINPAEAYVLGGAFLLHDAAHVVVAYPGRMKEIKCSVQWQDLIAQRYGGSDPKVGAPEEKEAIFQVLRQLHAKQAHSLAGQSWVEPASGEPLYLIENVYLRNYYADLIGEIAESHHWSPHEVADRFRGRRVACPAILSPATWEVDALKVALLLRTADAAHLDGSRAPWFLFALRQPQGVSATHWRFQAKLGQPSRTPTGELRLSSGSSFDAAERDAWWLAYDVAKMVDAELRSAHEILREEGRQPFASESVLGVDSPENFAKQVPVRGWIPIDVAPKVGDLTKLITRLGGAALYGENYAAPLREILQNGIDAVRALRALGGLRDDEGEVEVAVLPSGDGQWWLRVTDTGVGMSRYVLSNVLLDFGASLWALDNVREELPGLLKAGFSPVGKFGIGFFSVFMLGVEVVVTTRRFEPAGGDGVHWQLRFENGLLSRPAMLQPPISDQLRRSGTSVAVKLSSKNLGSLLAIVEGGNPLWHLWGSQSPSSDGERLASLVASLCPASAVRLVTRMSSEPPRPAVKENDWVDISDAEILNRSQCTQVPLLPLRGEDGELIGRVGVASNSFLGGAASVVYQGVLCGQAEGLAGVVKARENNTDARRALAAPGGDLRAWAKWAEEMIPISSPSLEVLLRLHPLIPSHDLAVWRFENDFVTFNELATHLERMDEVILYDGEITHDDSDDVSSWKFGEYFSATENVICVPSMGPKNRWARFLLNSRSGEGEQFPWSIGAAPIDYRERLLAELARIWKEFDTIEDELFEVGEVDGIKILRGVVMYRRTK